MANTLEKLVENKVVAALAKILANTYVLTVKTQNFHWNVIDPQFRSFHLLFESQYNDLAEAQDDLAERIRMVGHRSPGSMREFLALTDLKEEYDELDGIEMLTALLHDHEKVIGFLREAIVTSQDAGDEGTADLLINRLRSHEKVAWMLRSHL